MRLERLLAIVVLLINRRTVRARELAQMFEVSERTIYRDIEAINQAGIPIVTYPGANGGIGLWEGYRMEQSLLSLDDIIALHQALKGLQTVWDDPGLSQTLDKIQGLIPAAQESEFTGKSDQMMIDLTPWGGSSSDEGALKQLREALDDDRLVSFEYATPEGQITYRTVEPDCLVLKAQYWYLHAYCRLRSEYRLFRVSRMRSLRLEDDRFVRRKRQSDPLPEQPDWPSGPWVDLVLKFIPELQFLVHEQFQGAEIEPDADGSLLVRLRVPESEWLYGMILSYSDGVQVLEPSRVRQAILSKIEHIRRIYG